MDDVQDTSATVAAEAEVAQPAVSETAAPAETTAAELNRQELERVTEAPAETAPATGQAKEGPAIQVSGDPEGGWVVEIHDGDTHSTYTCMAPSEQDAVALAVAEHRLSQAPAARDRIAHLEDVVAQLADKLGEHQTTIAQMVDASHSLSNRIHTTGLRVDALEGSAKGGKK